MKGIDLFLVAIIASLLSGCSDQGSPVNTILPGIYSGTYTIQQSQYLQQGTVTLSFNGNSFEYLGRIETQPPPEPDFHQSGTATFQRDTVIFNLGQERSLSMKMRLYPAWWLDGSFKYRYANSHLTLEQNAGPWFVYRMELEKR